MRAPNFLIFLLVLTLVFVGVWEHLGNPGQRSRTSAATDRLREGNTAFPGGTFVPGDGCSLAAAGDGRGPAEASAGEDGTVLSGWCGWPNKSAFRDRKRDRLSVTVAL